MSLTQQFFIVLLLPASLVAIMVIFWRRGGTRRHGPYWLLALLSASLWASSLLSYYGGARVPAELAFSWRIAGHHLLSLLALLLLATTTAYLTLPKEQARLTLVISSLFWIASFLLDPSIWPYRLPAWTLGEYQGNHFSLWSAVWVTSYLIPLLAAALITRQSVLDAQSSLTQNRLNYWQITLALFALGGALALVQQPEQPIWQELGGLGIILASVTGTATLTWTNLPNLRITLRHAVARLTTTLVIYALAWFALWLFARSRPAQSNVATILDLTLTAALFTAATIAVIRFMPQLMRRVFLSDGHSRSATLAGQPKVLTGLLDANVFGRLLLHLIQSNLTAEQGRLFLVEDGPAGGYLLRPLAAVGYQEEATAMQIAGSSPLAAHLRRPTASPLSGHEIQTLSTLVEVPDEEKAAFLQWQSHVLFPVWAGDKLVALLTLGEKYTGEAYTHDDLAWIEEMVSSGGLLLWQTLNLQNVKRVNDYAFAQLQALARETQHLQELLALHERFSEMVSPALRRPLDDIYATLQQLEEKVEGNGQAITLDALNTKFAQLQVVLNNLMLAADRVQQQRHFSPETVHVADVVDRAVRNLRSMAAARRVEVHVESEPQLPDVEADEQRLLEAVQQLLHNAIKFNKIGGEVKIVCGTSGDELYLHVRDTGVGIPPSRLQEIWTAAAASEAAEAKGGGPGLGLLLTRFIVRSHGGRVQAESEYGAGSTFSIFLPSTADDTAAPTLENVESPVQS